MARRIAKTTEQGESEVFVVNETTIGKGANNRKRSDVQLVQFFLKQFFIIHPELFAKLPKLKKNASNVIKIDGVFGSQSEAGIFEFQKHVKSKGNPIKVDRKVSVPTDVKSTGGNIFTIVWLNFFFKASVPGSMDLGTLENHPDIIAFAPELRAELLRDKV